MVKATGNHRESLRLIESGQEKVRMTQSWTSASAWLRLGFVVALVVTSIRLTMAAVGVAEEADRQRERVEAWEVGRDANLAACYEDPACDVARREYYWENVAERPPTPRVGDMSKFAFAFSLAGVAFVLTVRTSLTNPKFPWSSQWSRKL